VSTLAALRGPAGVAALALLLALSVAAPAAGAAGDPRRAGAYCPFPENLKKGEVPECFTSAQREYPEFLAAVESGRIDDPGVTRLEQQLEAAGSEESDYLALSSLAYGYFRLAERVAHSERPNPALVARLQSWNQLLSGLYQKSEASPQLRSAVGDAAQDLHARAPAVTTECPPGSQDETCQTTGVLLQTLRRIDDPADSYGVRRALGRLLDRMRSDDDAPLSRPAGNRAE
jgi:hypothetical protein